MNTLENVKQWFIDRDLENGGRLDKQSLKLSEEFGELCAGYLKKNEQLTKDSIGYQVEDVATYFNLPMNVLIGEG